MTVLNILKVPNGILRQKAKKIKTIDSSIKKLAEDMFDTMKDAGGAGLAAPQVGVLLRLVVVDSLSENSPYILINPEIIKEKGEKTVYEGCLSIPGYRGEIKRAETVIVKARDIEGKEVRIRGQELLAQILQHEIDHLDGMLYIDLLESPEKLFRSVPEEMMEPEKVTPEAI